MGTAIDATLIAAPTSTKNKDKARDPEMHSSKKGNQWYFGMKAHIGVDADSGLIQGWFIRYASLQGMCTTLTKATLCCMEKKVWSLPMRATKAYKSG